MVVKRSVVMNGERKDILEIQIRHSWLFKRYMKRLARQGYFVYDKKSKTWYLRKDISKQEFLNLMVGLKNYVKDVFVEDGVYEEVYETLQKIVIPDPSKLQEERTEKVATAKKKEPTKRDVMWKGNVGTKLKKGEMFSAMSDVETQTPPKKIEMDMWKQLKKLDQMMTYLLTYAMQNKKYIAPSIYGESPSQLMELGFKKDSSGKLSKVVPKNVMYSELQDIKNLLGKDVMSVETKPDEFDRVKDEVIEELKQEKEVAMEAEM